MTDRITERDFMVYSGIKSARFPSQEEAEQFATQQALTSLQTYAVVHEGRSTFKHHGVTTPYVVRPPVGPNQGFQTQPEALAYAKEQAIHTGRTHEVFQGSHWRQQISWLDAIQPCQLAANPSTE